MKNPTPLWKLSNKGELILITGGVRSGKSRYALKIGGEEGIFIATGKETDEEMKKKIRKHKKERPKKWKTKEEGVELVETIEEEKGNVNCIIIDCLGFWVANVMEKLKTLQKIEKKIKKELKGLKEIVNRSPLKLIIVSNEVGMGVVPSFKKGRMFRDLLGEANQFLAKEADEVFFLVSGIPLKIK